VEKELAKYYKGVWQSLTTIARRYSGVSLPLFVSIPSGYERSALKLMVVGQQTNSWYGFIGDSLGSDPVSRIQTYYRRFNFAEGYNSPFWHAIHNLQASLEPRVAPRSFVWSNLYICDQKKILPDPFLCEQLLDLRTLPHEIAILRPDAVVFFTGPHYDYTIKTLFPDVRLSRCGSRDARLFSRVEHSELPRLSFRTYHPAYLRRSGQFGILRTISRLLNEV
jgi:hypothetical protein